MPQKTLLTTAVLAALVPACAASTPTTPATAAPRPLAAGPRSGADVPEIRYLVVDQFGYRPDMKKVGILVDPQAGWNAADAYTPGDRIELRRFADGSLVLAGAPVTWKGGAIEPSSGDRGSWFDFSSVTEPGSYFLFDPANGVRSAR